MADPAPHHSLPDIVLPHEPVLPMPPATASQSVAAHPATAIPTFDSDSTMHFQAKMSKAPEWFCSFMASNHREKRRFRDELVHMKGAWPLLMKQRNGGTWTADDKSQLKTMVRSASSVSPYLFIWAIPGSMLMLPFLAWFLDKNRKRRARKNGG